MNNIENLHLLKSILFPHSKSSFFIQCYLIQREIITFKAKLQKYLISKFIYQRGTLKDFSDNIVNKFYENLI